MQALGDVADGADVGCDVLAHHAVAAGGSAHEHARLVAQRAGEPVDLGLGHEVDGRIGREIEEAANAGDELVHLLCRHRVVEREHRDRVDDLAEGLDRLGTDTG